MVLFTFRILLLYHNSIFKNILYRNQKLILLCKSTFLSDQVFIKINATPYYSTRNNQNQTDLILLFLYYHKTVYYTHNTYTFCKKVCL